jgi:hypothetical protein
MFLHFYYVNCKKEKKDYIIIYKYDKEIVSFSEFNNILYKEIYNDKIEDSNDKIEDSNDKIEDSNINFYELFYIKKGLKIKYKKELWNSVINMYLNKLNIQTIIDDKYVEKIWNSNLLLFLIDKYDDSLKQFLITHYKNNFNK